MTNTPAVAPPPTYEQGSAAIRDSQAFALFLGSMWHPLLWGAILAGVLFAIATPLLLATGSRLDMSYVLTVLVLPYGFSFWACFYRVPENSNGIISRFGSYSPHVLPPGWSFNGPWPFYRLTSGSVVGLQPFPFALAPKDVDTFEGPTGSGIQGGQITVMLTGMARVKYPLLFLLCGGWSKVLPQVENALDSVVRQYCAMRTFDELKHEKGTGDAASVFRGSQIKFCANIWNEELSAWELIEYYINVSGYTLLYYLLRYGIEIYSLEVLDFTPTNVGLREAQDLAAIAEEKKRQGAVAIRAITEGATALAGGIAGLDPNTAARIAAGANNVGDLKMIDMGGGSGNRVLVNSN